MNNVIKGSFYSVAWLMLVGINNVNAAWSSMFWKQSDVDNVSWTTKGIDEVIKSWMWYLVSFLYLIAIIMMIYGGFNILTAGWDEEKVKKGKTILMQAVGGLVVVFIANSVITWLMDSLFGTPGLGA